MRGEFSFCGVDIADIGLEYAPDNKDTYIYAPSVSNIHEETFEGHDGGCFYGASKEPKTFTLRCFYEDKHIAKGLMAKVFDLFRVGRKGMLIFKRRPWCYYYATVTENPNIEDMYTYENGLITITMKAYYPYARGINITNDETEEARQRHLFYNTDIDRFHDEIMQNTAVLDKEYMVPTMSFNSVPAQPILLFNPGTEKAKLDIALAGNAGTNGVTIGNNTNKLTCRYVAFTSDSGEIYTDGITGKTVATKNGDTRMAFLYHDHGFIELEPAFPSMRNIFASYTENSSTVSTINYLYENDNEKDWYVGKYIYLGEEEGKWYKIARCVNKQTLQLTQTSEVTGMTKTSIVLMNEIYVTGGEGLTKLSFIYKPTYA